MNTDTTSALYGLTNYELLQIEKLNNIGDLLQVCVWTGFTLVAVLATYLLLTRVIFKWVNYLFKFRL